MPPCPHLPSCHRRGVRAGALVGQEVSRGWGVWPKPGWRADRARSVPGTSDASGHHVRPQLICLLEALFTTFLIPPAGNGRQFGAGTAPSPCPYLTKPQILAGLGVALARPLYKYLNGLPGHPCHYAGCMEHGEGSIELDTVLLSSGSRLSVGRAEHGPHPWSWGLVLPLESSEGKEHRHIQTGSLSCSSDLSNEGWTDGLLEHSKEPSVSWGELL